MRTWDYCYCWLRDATFTLQALIGTGSAPVRVGNAAAGQHQLDVGAWRSMCSTWPVKPAWS